MIGLFMKTGLCSFNVRNASRLAELSMRSSILVKDLVRFFVGRGDAVSSCWFASLWSQ